MAENIDTNQPVSHKKRNIVIIIILAAVLIAINVLLVAWIVMGLVHPHIRRLSETVLFIVENIARRLVFVRNYRLLIIEAVGKLNGREYVQLGKFRIRGLLHFAR